MESRSCVEPKSCRNPLPRISGPTKVNSYPGKLACEQGKSTRLVHFVRRVKGLQIGPVSHWPVVDLSMFLGSNRRTLMVKE